MNRLNLAGQSVLSSSSAFNNYNEQGKSTPNNDTPSSQYSYNQKYYNGSSTVTNRLESTFSSMVSNTPISHRQNEFSDAYRAQRFQQMSNASHLTSVSPVPFSKNIQMDQTASSNMSGITSSNFSQNGLMKPSSQMGTINKTERNYFQYNQSQFNQPFQNNDQRDGLSTISTNTQQRFIYSRNGSEKSISTNYYQQQQQKDFAASTKSNFEQYLNINNFQNDQKMPSKYKVRSCVNMKSSTKLNNAELTFLSQAQAVNEQILNTPNQNENYAQKIQSDINLQQQNFNTTPINPRKSIHTSNNLNDTTSMTYRLNQNSSSTLNLKSELPKDIINKQMLIESNVNLSQMKDTPESKQKNIIQNFQNINYNSQVFSSSRPKKMLESSNTFKNIFYQQVATNQLINKNKTLSKNAPNYNKSSTNLNIYDKSNDTPINETRKRTQSKMENIQPEINADSDEDRRLYEELLDMSPLPKTRKIVQEGQASNKKSEGLIQLQLLLNDKVIDETDAPNNQDNQKQQDNINNLDLNSLNKDDFNFDNNSSYQSVSVQVSERQIKQIKSNNQNKQLQKNSHGGKSQPHLNNQKTTKESKQQKIKEEERTKKTNKFVNNYKKIKLIVDEVQHFNDSMEVDQAMLTTTITKNILPRKLGIVASYNPNIKNINDALKQRKKRQSFDANGSPLKLEQKGELPSVIASKTGKRVSEFLNNTNNDFSDEKSKPQSSSNFSMQFNTPITNTSKVANQKEQLYNRGPSMSEHMRRTPSKSFSHHNNGLIESEMRRTFDKQIFNDSDEVASYLQKNCLVKSNEADVQEQKKNLNLSRLQISKTYSEMLAQALTHRDFENLNSLNLVDNNLTGSALLLISQNLPQFIRKIDLSQNFLNGNDSNSICNILNSKKYESLISLNLSNNQLSDVGLKAITLSLQNNSNLLSLNISHNKLTDLSSAYLKEILLVNSYLQELYLSWNKISSRSGLELAAGLSNNFNIRVLDLSHNCLGQNPNLHSGKKLIESCTKLESSLIHLDLSYNLFTKSECQEIATSLSLNKKIYGFHFEGNEQYATVDARGFVYFPDEEQILQKHVSTHTLMRRDIKSVKCLGMNKLQNFNCNVTDNCWICDGWQEVEFEIKEGCSDIFMGEPVFLHLDFEDFKPMYMDRDPNDQTRFFLRRMCPPNRTVLFFFTNPCTKLLFESNDYEILPFHVNEQNLAIYEDGNFEENTTNQQKDQNSPNSNNDLFSAHHLQHSKQRKFNVKYLDGTVCEYIVPTTVNCLKTKLHMNIKKNKGEYDVHIKCLPRQEETYYKINYTNQWHRGISLFQSYIPDNPEIEMKCLEDDWNNCKIQQIFSQYDKNVDISECKRIILEKYPLIRIIYRYLSCFGIVNDVFCVTLSPFSLFAQQSKIVDNNLMKMRDIECLFIASSSKALKVKNYRAPEKALIRSEFIEVMGRIAIDKYIRNKVVKSSSEALNLLLNNQVFLEHVAEYEDPQKWRNIRYWTKQCDEMMKRYLNFIKALWNEYADSRKGEKRGISVSQKTMSLQEFQEMVNEFYLKDNLLSEREVIMSFNLSLMSIVDEINSEKYMAMTFVEFLEGLARLSEFKSKTPVGERPECYQDDEKVQIRLEYKIESLLEHMSIKYEEVMKNRRKKYLLLQKQIQQRNTSKLQSLKVRKSFIQYSQSEIESPEKSNNKFVNTVQRVMNSMTIINAIKESKQNSNSSLDESDSKSQKFGVSSFTSQTDINNKINSRQLHRIDSENDEFEDEENSFSNSIKKKRSKKSQLIQEFDEEEGRPISLKNIADLK